jgi:hypothetical protein
MAVWCRDSSIRLDDLTGYARAFGGILRPESRMMRDIRRVGVAALLFASTSCGDAGGPALHGPPSFAVTLDGAGWVPDTAVTIAYASLCDTTVFISAVRNVSDQEVEEVLLIVHRFPAAGQLALSDTSTLASAAFSESQMSGSFPVSTVTYWTRPAAPGLLTIVGATRDDSLITGRFAFQAATIPDAGIHRQLTGQFRVRYTLQPVYTVPGC